MTGHWLDCHPSMNEYNNVYKKQWRIWRLQFRYSGWTYKSKCWLFPSGFTGGPWMLLNLDLWSSGNLWDQAPWRLAQSLLEHTLVFVFPSQETHEWSGEARLVGHFQSPLLVISSSITRVEKVRTWGKEREWVWRVRIQGVRGIPTKSCRGCWKGTLKVSQGRFELMPQADAWALCLPSESVFSAEDTLWYLLS